MQTIREFFKNPDLKPGKTVLFMGPEEGGPHQFYLLLKVQRHTAVVQYDKHVGKTRIDFRGKHALRVKISIVREDQIQSLMSTLEFALDVFAGKGRRVRKRLPEVKSSPLLTVEMLNILRDAVGSDLTTPQMLLPEPQPLPKVA